MLPPSPCWTKINVLAPSSTPSIPSGVHPGDNLVWINGAWMSVPASVASPCGHRTFYGHLVSGNIVSAADLVSQGTVVDPRMAYFNPVTSTLFVFNQTDGTWGVYTGCTGDKFTDIATAAEHNLTFTQAAGTGTSPAPPARSYFGHIVTASDVASLPSGLNTKEEYYNPDKDILFEYNSALSTWQMVPVIPRTEFVDIQSGNIYLRGT